MTKIDLETFETSEILKAVDYLDRLRALLADSDFGEPSIRDDLLRLHKLAMNANGEDATELANHAFEVECQIDDLSEAVDKIQSILMKITRSIYDDDEEID
ncbi:hypothetical protein [Planctomycetes bacterium TBK1r]|uniref:Transposase n=1 Tax=Stieleria magnilauensis TaxID=2527963 RepID=A0ABX5XGZ2_9BACT|nr:hypothetical protein TBK1r_01680 [Planctomycetes bacterium TBK1r]